MKKRFFLLPLLLLSNLPLSSCGTPNLITNLKTINPTGAFYRIPVKEEISGPPTEDSLPNMIKQKQSFILYVFKTNDEETSKVTELVSSYIKKTENLVFAVQDIFYESRESSLELPTVTYPALIFIKDGLCLGSESTTSNKKAFQTLESLTNMMNSYLDDSNLYALSSFKTYSINQLDYFLNLNQKSAFYNYLDGNVNVSITKQEFSLILFDSSSKDYVSFYKDVIASQSINYSSSNRGVKNHIFLFDTKYYQANKEAFNEIKYTFQLPDDLDLSKNPVYLEYQNGKRIKGPYSYGGDKIETIDQKFVITASTHPSLVQTSYSSLAEAQKASFDEGYNKIESLLKLTIKKL